MEQFESDPYRPPDELRQDIIDQLRWDIRVDAKNIQVDVDGDMVRLSGTVPTYSARMAAAEDAWAIPGVATILNDLIVVHTEETLAPEDYDIAHAILEGWRGDAELGDASLDAAVASGWATLEGTVDNVWKKRRAEELAGNIAGVRGITNKIAVVPTHKHRDEVIATSIEEALDRHHAIPVDAVTVTVEDAIVTLDGTLPNAHVRSLAHDIAARTDGVLDVRDRLRIYPVTR